MTNLALYRVSFPVVFILKIHLLGIAFLPAGKLVSSHVLFFNKAFISSVIACFHFSTANPSSASSKLFDSSPIAIAAT